MAAGLYEEMDRDERRAREERAARFRDDLAHEIKNPLGAALGALETLTEDLSGEGVETRMRELARRNLWRAMELVDDLRLLIDGKDRGRPTEPRPVGTARIEGDEVLIHVRANGVDIPSESVNRVFERFFRVEQNGGNGSGLGLSIARQAVRQTGGDISVESELGVGSTFLIRTPVFDLNRSRPLRTPRAPEVVPRR